MYGETVTDTSKPRDWSPTPAELVDVAQLSSEDLRKLHEIHEWLEEIMPTLRQAKSMFENRGKLARRWLT